GRVLVGALGAIRKKAQASERAPDGVFPLDVSALHTDGIGREGEACSRNARRPARVRPIAYEAVGEVYLIDEIHESLLLQIVEQLGVGRCRHGVALKFRAARRAGQNSTVTAAT